MQKVVYYMVNNHLCKNISNTLNDITHITYCLKIINAYTITFQFQKLNFKYKANNMARKHKSDISKINNYVETYPNEFVKTKLNHILCKLCLKTVSFDRKVQIDTHRQTNNHTTELSQLTPLNFNVIISASHFPDQIVRTFLKTDITCHALDNKAWQDLFKSFGLPSISSSTAYRMVKMIANKKLGDIKVKLFKKQYLSFKTRQQLIIFILQTY